MHANANPAYAQLHERFLARLLDGIITAPFFQLLVYSFGVESLISAVAGFTLGICYYAYFLASPWQATLGKRVVGLHVTQSNGGRLSFKDAAARELAASVPMYPIYVSFLSPQMAFFLFFALSLIWFGRILLDHKRRAGMHDILCQTTVVRGRIPTRLWG